MESDNVNLSRLINNHSQVLMRMVIIPFLIKYYPLLG